MITAHDQDRQDMCSLSRRQVDHGGLTGLEEA